MDTVTEVPLEHPSRRSLIKRLTEALKTTMFPSFVRACLYVSDIEKLEELVQVAEANPEVSSVIMGGLNVGRIIDKWLQRVRTPAAPTTRTLVAQSPLAQVTTPSPLHATPSPLYATPSPLYETPSPMQPPRTPSAAKRGHNDAEEEESRPRKRIREGSVGSVGRSKQAADWCRVRDNSECILTKMGEPIDVAHLYPYSMRNDRPSADPSNIWRMMRIFWTSSRVQAWEDAIFPNGTEVVQNLVCLAPHCHRYHGAARFALKPLELSADRRRLKVGFFWFPLHKNSSSVDVFECPSMPHGLSHGPNKNELWNAETHQILRSGDEIWLETDDPLLKPLPDWRILDMQWVFQRVAALSGAAEPSVDVIDSDGDSDDSVAFLEENSVLDEDDYPGRQSIPTSPVSCCKPVAETAPEEFSHQLKWRMVNVGQDYSDHKISEAEKTGFEELATERPKIEPRTVVKKTDGISLDLDIDSGTASPITMVDCTSTTVSVSVRDNGNNLLGVARDPKDLPKVEESRNQSPLSSSCAGQNQQERTEPAVLPEAISNMTTNFFVSK